MGTTGSSAERPSTLFRGGHEVWHPARGFEPGVKHRALAVTHRLTGAIGSAPTRKVPAPVRGLPSPEPRVLHCSPKPRVPERVAHLCLRIQNRAERRRQSDHATSRWDHATSQWDTPTLHDSRRSAM